MALMERGTSAGDALRREARVLARKAARLLARVGPALDSRLDAVLGADAEEFRDVVSACRALAAMHPEAGPQWRQPSFSARTLTAGTAIPKVRLGRVGKDASRLVLGTNKAHALPRFEAVADAYFEAGGNVFDCAHHYRIRGQCDRLVGAWLRSRGVRDQCVILDKGCHPDAGFGEPRFVAGQVAEALEALGTETLDLWMPIHDVPSVPVGEWVDAMNEVADRGLVRAIGVSNWSLARIDAANAYAAAKGKRGVEAVSNYLGLPAMLDSLCVAGSVSARDAASAAWFAAHPNVPLFGWSAQGRGFFRGIQNPQVVRMFLGDANLRRLAKARQIAQAKAAGTTAGQVGLAWVLAQACRPLAVIGPDTVEDLQESIGAAGLTLTAAELAALEG